MKRRLFNIFSVVSLLLFVATVPLWIESYSRNRGFIRLSPGASYFAIESTNGRIGLFRLSPLPAGVDPPARPPYADAYIIETTPDGTVPVKRADRVLSFPYWSVAGLTGLPCCICALACQRQRRAVFRRTHGLCQQCGYDLRASKERCSECGTPIPAQADDATKPA